MISSTNRDLTQAVKDGRFREDLFFRLNVIPITLPPLRERRGDIRLLAEFFLKKHSHELKRPGLSFSPTALEALEQYDWPGNVRELENLLERAVVLASGDQIHAEDLALPGLRVSANGPVSTYQAQLDAAEKEMLRQVLRDHDGDKRAAARAIGMALSTSYAKLKRHQL